MIYPILIEDNPYRSKSKSYWKKQQIHYPKGIILHSPSLIQQELDSKKVFIANIFKIFIAREGKTLPKLKEA